MIIIAKMTARYVVEYADTYVKSINIVTNLVCGAKAKAEASRHRLHIRLVRFVTTAHCRHGIVMRSWMSEQNLDDQTPYVSDAHSFQMNSTLTPLSNVLSLPSVSSHCL